MQFYSSLSYSKLNQRFKEVIENIVQKREHYAVEIEVLKFVLDIVKKNSHIPLNLSSLIALIDFTNGFPLKEIGFAKLRREVIKSALNNLVKYGYIAKTSNKCPSYVFRKDLPR